MHKTILLIAAKLPSDRPATQFTITLRDAATDIQLFSLMRSPRAEIMSAGYALPQDCSCCKVYLALPGEINEPGKLTYSSPYPQSLDADVWRRATLLLLLRPAPAERALKLTLRCPELGNLPGEPTLPEVTLMCDLQLAADWEEGKSSFAATSCPRNPEASLALSHLPEQIYDLQSKTRTKLHL